MITPQVSTPLNAPFAPTIAIAAKAAGTCIGNKFTLAAPSPISSGRNGPTGIVQAMHITDKDATQTRMALMIYETDFTDAGDGNAFGGTEAGYVGHVLVNAADWLVLGGKGYATVSAYGLAGKVTGAQWFAQLVTVDGITTVQTDSIQGAVSGIIS